MRILQIVTLVLLTTLAKQASSAENCAQLTDKAETNAKAGTWENAKSLAQKAITACEKEHAKTARPQMVLATAANAEQDYNSVIQWSKEGLKQEPGLPLAYMNMCSAYWSANRFDDAIKSCQEGLKKKSPWEAKLNHNLGLSYFSKAIGAQDFPGTLASEKYFKESQKLDPSLAANYFYLGTLEQAVKNNPKAANEHYAKGCKLGDSRSCESQKKLLASGALSNAGAPANGADQPAAGKPNPVSGEEARLYEALRQSYSKKGLDAASVQHIIDSTKSSLQSYETEQRISTLKSMVEGAD